LHAEAWDTVQALFADLEAPAKAVRRQTAAPLTAKRPRRRRTASMATAVAACAGLIAVLPQSTLLQNLQSDYHTATGEQRLVTLTDGSRLLLNTDSAVGIEMTAAERRVTLLRGEAFFEVARAPQRPFWVVAGDARARVTGTAFSVGRRSENVAVTVTVTVTVAEGRVETSTESHPEQITPLTPGESAHYRGARLSAKQTADIPRELAWRQGQMVFVQAPLTEVVAQINRYRPGRLIVTDRQLENRPITAVFNIDKLDDAVSALEQTFGIRARRIADYWVLLG